MPTFARAHALITCKAQLVRPFRHASLQKTAVPHDTTNPEQISSPSSINYPSPQRSNGRKGDFLHGAGQRPWILLMPNHDSLQNKFGEIRLYWNCVTAFWKKKKTASLCTALRNRVWRLVIGRASRSSLVRWLLQQKREEGSSGIIWRACELWYHYSTASSFQPTILDTLVEIEAHRDHQV